MKRKPRLKGVVLAAPFVVTTLGGMAACEKERIYANPAEPQVPPSASNAAPDETAAPTASVATSASAAPSGSGAVVATATPSQTPDLEPIQAMPTGPGVVVKRSDGTCWFEFHVEMPKCPPHAFCNPGPPRRPVRVACADEKK